LTERVLGLILLISAILSATVMWVVQSHISRTPDNVSLESPAALNYLLQSDHNLDQFVAALHKAQLTEPNTAAWDLAVSGVQKRFDVMWGSFSIFELQFPIERTPENEVQAFIKATKRFLTDSDPMVSDPNAFDQKTLAKLQDHSSELSRATRIFGQGYFVNVTEKRDASTLQLQTLNGYMRLFIGLLLLTGGLGVGLLIRSNIRTRRLWVEAQDARTELALTVDELRSGRREQKAKDSFIASASHDLRQPLHALGLFLNTLKSEVKPSGQKALSEAVYCTEALNRLFNSMLDLSRLDAGIVSVTKEHFDLSALMQHLYYELQPSAKSHGIELTVTGPKAYAFTDSVLLGRILRNLIDNAVMHSEATKIAVDFRSVRDGYEIVVADNGRGIPLDEHRAVFSEYYQLKNPERDRSKGLGLGLSIVNRLSGLLKIPVSLESDVNRGARFTLTVPQGNATEQRIDSTTSTPRMDVDNNSVIVVIDDDASIRQAMLIMLNRYNFTTVTAESVDDALEQLAESSLEPDLVIADYRLRDHQTGDEVIHNLREMVDRDIPGLIITGDTSPQRVSDAAKTGFELMHKPVDADILHKKILLMLQEQEQEVTPA